VDREVGEDLPVQGDVGLLEPRDEARVGRPVLAGGGVDPGDPEPAELALAGAAVAVGVLEALLDGVLGNGVDVATAAPVTFRLLQELAATATGSHEVFCSGHFGSVVRVSGCRPGPARSGGC
jgi:hypothetical protein